MTPPKPHPEELAQGLLAMAMGIEPIGILQTELLRESAHRLRAQHEQLKSMDALNRHQTAQLEQVANGFPSACVHHLASKTCSCHHNGPEVERNAHWPSCMVGRAQAFLGRRVSWEMNGKPCPAPK